MKWLALALLIAIGLAGCGGGAWKPIEGLRVAQNGEVCAGAHSPDRTKWRMVCHDSTGFFCAWKRTVFEESDSGCMAARTALEKAHLLP